MSASLDKTELLAANQRFYDAFAARNIEAMDELWARTAPVACIHPGWGPLRDREQVMASWTGILTNSGSPQIRCTRATAHILGESAFVICEELVEGARLVATNIFTREGDAWKLVHHQASPIAHEISVVMTGDENETEVDPEEEETEKGKLN